MNMQMCPAFIQLIQSKTLSRKPGEKLEFGHPANARTLNPTHHHLPIAARNCCLQLLASMATGLAMKVPTAFRLSMTNRLECLLLRSSAAAIILVVMTEQRTFQESANMAGSSCHRRCRGG